MSSGKFDDSIYLDHAATTPIDPSVYDAMVPYLTDRFGNPSSIYQQGQQGRNALDTARNRAARVLGCTGGEILFTGGATESNNLALSGVLWAAKVKNPNSVSHLVTSQIEHHAVLHTAEWLEKIGFGLTLVGCDQEGLISVDRVLALLTPETALVSIMYANNEVGTVQPIANIGRALRERGVLFHVDATQAPGLLSLKVDELNVDLMSLSAHKLYGPKGVGLLYVRRGTPIEYQQHGGGQEGGRRGGTENVAGIAGFGLALEQAESTRAAYVEHCRSLTGTLWNELSERIPGVELNGPELDGPRLPNNLNFRIPGVQGETLLLSLDMQGIAASAGSACTTGNSQPSHVLMAMGLTEAEARTSMRLTVGRTNDLDQIEQAIEIIVESVARIRELGGS